MTKEELWERWIDSFGRDYILTGVEDEDKEQFFQDLEDFYVYRRKDDLEIALDKIQTAFDAMNKKQPMLIATNCNPISYDISDELIGIGHEWIRIPNAPYLHKCRLCGIESDEPQAKLECTRGK